MAAATNDVKWTVEQVKRGQLPVRVILAVLGILIALDLLASFAYEQPAGFLKSVVTAFVLGAWYLGYNWGRILFGCHLFLLTVGFLALAVWGLGYPSTYWLAIVGVLGAILMGIAAVGLLRSKNMRAYLWYLREKRTREQKKAREELETEIGGRPSEQAEDKPASK